MEPNSVNSSIDTQLKAFWKTFRQMFRQENFNHGFAASKPAF
jgi:hypothetical protein